VSDSDKSLLWDVVSQHRGAGFFNSEHRETSLQTVCQTYVDYEQAWINDRLTKAHRKQPAILYGFYERFELQALAVERPDVKAALVAISPHVIQLLAAFFNNAMSLNFIFPDIGNSSAELGGEQLKLKPVLLRRPQDETRRNIAKMLLMWSIRFLTAHELTHILHGHLRFRRIGMEASMMTETPHTLSPADALALQTLEMDADSGAVSECLRGIMFDPEDAIDLRNANLFYVYKDHLLALRLWSFATYSLFRVMHDSSSPVPDPHSSHPPPMTRALWVADTAFEVLLKSSFDITRELSLRYFTEATVAGERVFAWMVNSEPQLEAISAASSSTSYTSSILKEWGLLRPLLEPHNRAEGNLAPAQS
jgi:hypothetical protein